MMELCVILAANNQSLAFDGNVQSVQIMICAPFVIMEISTTYGIAFIGSLHPEVNGKGNKFFLFFY